MARTKDRQIALSLRKKGMSYSQIKKKLGISKSTLSYWLRDYPLSKQRINELRGRSEARIEKYRETMRKKRETRLLKFYGEEKDNILPFSDRDLAIAGLFLYWGEGAKTMYDTVRINNTDPSMIKFILFWMTKCLAVPKKKIKVSLHLYSDMNTNKEIKYWSNLLGISMSQFIMPYIKESKISTRTHRGYAHGTCGLSVADTRLKERVLMGIKSISDHFESISC